MAQYIDKDKVIAEIDRKVADNKKEIERASHKNLEDYFEGYEDALVLFKQQFLDTLEVKEVDLEKEIDEVIHNYKLNNHRHTSICAPDIEWIAEHFFELGLKAKDIDVENSFNAIVCKIGSTYLKEMDKDAIIKALEPYKNGDKVKIIIKA